MTMNNKKDSMLRCVCCNAQLTIAEMKMVQEDGSPEDMCGGCRSEVVYTDQEDDDWSHEYMFENLREGVTGVLTCDY
jgi:hypothetical protein